MAEYVRSITVSIEVDTNKQTFNQSFEGDSIQDALDKANEWVQDLRDRL